ncbi:hypothetical protein [Oscillatoria sp. HE19RPO]|uniref:hypothetical protein n=1 Tax=Oscillatoria sp. HE19RPO TaxID=2954806 RepID=UPI0020C26528|nr:hypothetical protein [Oscillatoria sp. HE19RPO]
MMGLSGGIGVGMLQAIAWDLGSYAGVSRLSGAIAIDTRDLSKILPNPHRLIVKFYELPPRDSLSSLPHLTRLGCRYSLGGDRPPQDREEGTGGCLYPHLGQKSERVRTSLQSFRFSPSSPWLWTP